MLNTTAMSDARVLDALAAEFDVELGCGDAATIRRELGLTPPTDAPRPAAPTASRRCPPPIAGAGEAILATWHQLLDLGSLTDGDEHLAGTARPPVVRLGKALAGQLGVADGDAVTVGTDRGAITLPARRSPTWPTASSGCRRTRPARPSAARSASPPAPSCR